MNELISLSSLGLELPSTTYTAGAILFGIVGYVAFRKGRKVLRPELTWVGVALMVYPYAVSETWALWLVGTLLCCWLYAKCN